MLAYCILIVKHSHRYISRAMLDYQNTVTRKVADPLPTHYCKILILIFCNYVAYIIRNIF